MGTPSLRPAIKQPVISATNEANISSRWPIGKLSGPQITESNPHILKNDSCWRGVTRTMPEFPCVPLPFKLKPYYK